MTYAHHAPHAFHVHRARRRIGVLATTLATLAATCAVVPDASATAPGGNGPIVFRRYLDADRTTAAIFTIRANGTGERRVTFPGHGTADNQPDWSPDRHVIAFERCAPDTVCAIYTVHADGTHLVRRSPSCNAKPPAIETKCADESRPAFLPDGHHLAFTRSTGRVDHEGYIEHSSIVVRDLSGRHARVVVRSRPFSGDNSQVVASPDGKRLAFQRGNSSRGTPVGGTAVFVVGINGRNLHRVTPWALDGGDHPDWSPNGAWILFRSNEGGGFLNSQLYLVHPNGTHLHPVTDVAADTLLLSASFSPDGTRITYAQAGRGGLPDIFTMTIHGDHRHQLTRTARWDSAPDWGPGLLEPR